MKITFYELLGLAKDGKAPKKIKYEYLIYELTPERNDYYCKNEMRWFTNEINSLGVLNDDVEIIEEDKKIEKIKSNGDEFYSDYIDAWISKNKTDAYCEFLMNKINELIDEINNLKEND